MTPLSVPEAVVLALRALAEGDRERALEIYRQLAALPALGESYRHHLRLLAAELGLGAGTPETISDRDMRHGFYHPPRSCQIADCGALYERLFGCKRDGSFVEIGAFDGEWCSNTAFLADLGWSGIYVEPHPTSVALCRARHRRNPNVQVVTCAIGAAEGIATLHLGEVLSTTTAAQVERYAALAWARPFHQGDQMEVPQMRLDALLAICAIDREFDLLVIDVEGGELAVLRSLDLAAWRPKVVIIELMDQHPDFALDAQVIAQATEIRGLLAQHGYTARYSDDTNSVFARERS